MVLHEILLWLGSWSGLGAAIAVYATRGGRTGPFVQAFGSITSDE